MNIEHHPNGNMCLVCKNLHKDCSGLPFNTYRTIDKYKEGNHTILVVKCQEFEREQNNESTD